VEFDNLLSDRDFKQKTVVVANIHKDKTKIKVKFVLEMKAPPLPHSQQALIEAVLGRFSLDEAEVLDLLKIRHGDDDHDDDDDKDSRSTEPSDPARADINNDGVVDKKDLNIMFDEWGKCEACTSDLNEDGRVTINDMMDLFAAWSDLDTGTVEIESEKLKSKFIFRPNSFKATIELKYKIDSISKADIIASIVEQTDLSLSDLFEGDEFIVKNKMRDKDHDDDKDKDHDDDHDDDKDKDHDDDDDNHKDKDGKKKIEIEIDKDDRETEVEIEWLGREIEYETRLIDKELILEDIAKRLGLTVEEIMPFVEIEIDD